MSKSFKIMKGLTSSLIDSSIKMSPIRPIDECEGVLRRGFHNISFDPKTFGGPQCRAEQTITKGEQSVMFVDGVIHDYLNITTNHIWIYWENDEVHYEYNRIDKIFFPNEHWYYDMHWFIPTYSPPGLFKGIF